MATLIARNIYSQVPWKSGKLKVFLSTTFGTSTKNREAIHPFQDKMANKLLRDF